MFYKGGDKIKNISIPNAFTVRNPAIFGEPVLNKGMPACVGAACGENTGFFELLLSPLSSQAAETEVTEGGVNMRATYGILKPEDTVGTENEKENPNQVEASVPKKEKVSPERQSIVFIDTAMTTPLDNPPDVAASEIAAEELKIHVDFFPSKEHAEKVFTVTVNHFSDNKTERIIKDSLINDSRGVIEGESSLIATDRKANRTTIGAKEISRIVTETREFGKLKLQNDIVEKKPVPSENKPFSKDLKAGAVEKRPAAFGTVLSVKSESGEPYEAPTREPSKMEISAREPLKKEIATQEDLGVATTGQKGKNIPEVKPKKIFSAEEISLGQDTVFNKVFTFKTSRPETKMTVTPEEVVPQIARAIESEAVKGTDGKFKIKLKPEGLGEITVEMKNNTDGIEIVIKTELTETKELIGEELDTLRNELISNNGANEIKLSSLTVKQEVNEFARMFSGGQFAKREQGMMDGGKRHYMNEEQYGFMESDTVTILPTVKIRSGTIDCLV
ncbi:MAG TPA: hypothetical protein DD733_03070 [Clostridiales bacterium]|nr:hypothetical protein [Clostridiales bacterium]